MFSLRQRILRPATSAANRFISLDLSLQSIPCALPAFEKAAVSLLPDPRNTAAVTRRNISTTINNNQQPLLQLEDSSFAMNRSLATSPILPFASHTMDIVAMASNWLESAWNNPRSITSLYSNRWNDGLLFISTLKRRRKMMNKHKLRKRRKKNRMKNKK